MTDMQFTDESQTSHTSVDEIYQFIVLLRQMCGILLECGCSSNRIEHLVNSLGKSWEYEVEALALPTGVWLAIRDHKKSYVELTRVTRWSVDLDKLARINALVDSVAAHQLSIAEARSALTAIAKSPPPYPGWLTVLAGGMASSVLVYFYQGKPLEVGLAFIAGILLEGVRNLSAHSEENRYLNDFAGAAVVTLFAFVCQAINPDVDAPKLIVGGLIALVPGLVFLNAIHEVAQKNLVSGAAKLLEALVIAASLAAGVLFISTIMVLIQSYV